MPNGTRVKEIKIKSKTLFGDCQTSDQIEPVELPPKQKQWNILFFHADQLVRNFAIVGVLLLTVLALKSSPSPQAQSVFSALQESAGMEWDESVGKLSFVGSFLPESIQAVWNAHDDLSVYAPVSGETVHAWSRMEPYVEIQSATRNVFAAADGEVMSIAHGMAEERIVRLRHEDGVETIYGNLKSCFVQEGDRVWAGDVIADLLDEKKLVFELRIEGKSVDPQGKMMVAE